MLIGRQGALCGNINHARGEFRASEHAIVVTPKREADTTLHGTGFAQGVISSVPRRVYDEREALRWFVWAKRAASTREV